ncbi:hypothetical protein [Paenibacillus sp. MMS18-CY102]|uniref:hypothetical protein n=1 Tax=Paenibacillus sp. MMS18-CY102 TaxID=2682849 RepID=UPI001365D153|nr:hypothetical protein [Paenibacillus sp. MMS18-CY102]MWC30102.1 hypothetical protein [Paenibacillus sp. MMS18-CY102]
MADTRPRSSQVYPIELKPCNGNCDSFCDSNSYGDCHCDSKLIESLDKQQGRDPRRKDDGGIVLEASIVLPFFLLFAMVLVIVIRLAAVQIALQSASVQTAKQTAAHWHPVVLATQSMGAIAAYVPAVQNQKLSQWSEVAAEAASWLPDPVGTLSSAALRGDWGTIADYGASAAGREALTPLLRRYADQPVLRADGVALHKAVLPTLAGGGDAYLELEAEYIFPLRIPLLNRSITLREQAVERAWAPDSLPAQHGSEAANDTFVQIVALEPDPLRPGRKAVVTARTKPNTSLTLSILYKSGYSEARNVGTAVSDSNGYVTWTWLVSGNTTPGIWSLSVEAADGVSAIRSFAVEKSPA